MTATEALERRIDELCSENERLRQQNAKLRKLLIDLKCAPCCGDSCWLHLPERLRELGVEVDE
jgi:hypothetical protein